jgi:hypothetical protein
VLLLLTAGWLALRGALARGNLQAAATLGSTLQDRVRAGDDRGAARTLARLQDRTGAARGETSDPLWRLAGTLPWVGDDAATVTALTRAVDDLARHGLPPLVDAARQVAPAAAGGPIDLAGLGRVGPGLGAAHDEIRRISAGVARLDRAGLLPPLRSAVRRAGSALDAAATLTATGRDAATALPSLLGADGPRTYLLIFQNPAEVRATGGLPGAYAVVHVDRGKVRLTGQGSAVQNLRTFPAPVVPLTRDQESLYTDRLATFPGDVNFTPHFPTAATIFREMYRRRTGQTVDGVLATDPVALSYLLRGARPLPLPGGETLRSDNAVRLLLSDVYARFPDPRAQDAFFAAAAKATFAALTGGRVGGAAALAGLGQAVEEHRLLVWSARPAEQRVLAGTALGGVLPEREGRTPVIGVFLNDGTGAKLDYYVRQSLRVTGGSCAADGRRLIRLRVTLRSTAPPTGLPRWVLGGAAGLAPGVVRTNVLFFSPVDGAIEDARTDGAPVGVSTGFERGRMVGYVTVDLPPGAEHSVDLTVSTPPIADAGPLTPRFWTTPTSTPWNVGPATVRCSP